MKGMPKKAVGLLQEKRTTLVSREASSSHEDSNLVFATPESTPLDAQNTVNRHYKPLLEDAGLPPIRWQDLRHPCATCSWDAVFTRNRSSTFWDTPR